MVEMIKKLGIRMNNNSQNKYIGILIKNIDEFGISRELFVQTIRFDYLKFSSSSIDLYINGEQICSFFNIDYDIIEVTF